MSRQIGYGEPLSDDDLEYLRGHNDPRGFVVAQADEETAASAPTVLESDEADDAEDEGSEPEIVDKPKRTRARK